MKWIIIGLLLFTICDPLVLHAKKVVVFMPRHIRRTQSSPWRHLMQLKKKAFADHGFPGHRYGYSHGPQLYRPKEIPVSNDQYPSGGDDFDQGHEQVNHVYVPHGKGISHAVSFGKGYIPFDTYKDYRPSVSHHHNYKPDVATGQDVQYHQPVNYPSGPSYSQAYLSQQADSYLSQQEDSSVENGEYIEEEEIQDRSHERTGQSFLAGKLFTDSSKSSSIDSLQGGHSEPTQGLVGKAGGVYTPVGIPSATIGGSKHGIVLRDSVSFDDYHKKVTEFTKNWPSSFSSNNFVSRGIGNFPQGSLQHLDGPSRQFDAFKFPSAGFPGKSIFASSFDQGHGQQGYAVKEDIDDTPHDFRTMPIQTAPVQSSPLEALHQPVPQIIQQQPVQQSIQHFYQQPQVIPQVPVNYAQSSYQGFIHG